MLQKAKKNGHVNSDIDIGMVARELLWRGSKYGRSSVVELALSLPLDIHDTHQAKQYAASRGRGSIFAKLMEKNKSDDPDLDLDDCLVEAASRGYVIVTQVILESGHSSRSGRQPRDDKFYSALDIAARKGHTACFDALLKYRPLDKQMICKVLELAFFKRYPHASQLLQAKVSEKQ